jgi:hypothetical protein
LVLPNKRLAFAFLQLVRLYITCGYSKRWCWSIRGCNFIFL